MRVLDWCDRRGILMSVDGMPPADDVTATVVSALEARQARRHLDRPVHVAPLAA